jgi:hypothetical protein
MTENPYRLARDIRGIGFKTADAIAMKLGLREPRIIAAHRQAHRIYPGMIPLCSRFDSMLFTPKRSAIATFGYFSRLP